jgi:hypothetical protein
VSSRLTAATKTPAAVERRRHEGDALAIGRPSRLEVDPAVGEERPRRAALEVEHAEIDRLAIVRREHHIPAVGRPVRLIVVAPSGGELARLGRAESLAPE